MDLPPENDKDSWRKLIAERRLISKHFYDIFDIRDFSIPKVIIALNVFKSLDDRAYEVRSLQKSLAYIFYTRASFFFRSVKENSDMLVYDAVSKLLLIADDPESKDYKGMTDEKLFNTVIKRRLIDVLRPHLNQKHPSGGHDKLANVAAITDIELSLHIKKTIEHFSPELRAVFMSEYYDIDSPLLAAMTPKKKKKLREDITDAFRNSEPRLPTMGFVAMRETTPSEPRDNLALATSACVLAFKFEYERNKTAKTIDKWTTAFPRFAFDIVAEAMECGYTPPEDSGPEISEELAQKIENIVNLALANTAQPSI